MNVVPIVFAFDNNLLLPASVCIYSLLVNAQKDTFYDIFILHSKNDALKIVELDKVASIYRNCKIHYREVDNTFDNAFEIRGITTPAYYRLLIPQLVKEYDKILYSDVDVIFRSDLYGIYSGTDLTDYYIAGVNSLSHLLPENVFYYKKLGIDAREIIYSGNIILNSKKILEDGIIENFISLSKKKYKFQDMDILNIACLGKIKYLSLEFCMTTYMWQWNSYNKSALREFWDDTTIERALSTGIIHYNGQKPWKQYSTNFDIWWEYYRKSPIFDEKFYFDFFYYRLNIFDQLSLWKRIKILVRYFVYGKRTI